MSKILVFHFHNHAIQPRLQREYDALMPENDVCGMGYVDCERDGVVFYVIKKPLWTLWCKIIQRLKLLFRFYESAYWALPHIKEAAEILCRNKFDIIIAHDMDTVPVALKYANGAKVIANMHEYAPREFDAYFWWRFYFSGYKTYLCRKYLPQADYCFTVGEKIANEYKKEFGVSCDVIINSAPHYECIPAKTTDTVKIIHHGMASPDRLIHLMIETMDYVDDRFTLDLMLVPTADKKYFQKLEEMAFARQNVNIIKPVSFEKIIPFCNNYDIGLYILPHTSFNTANALPNKFFEFIQARLAIAIGPSPEMARLVDEYKLGIVSKSFEPTDMAKELNSLTKEQITKYKQNADVAARELNAEKNVDKIKDILKKAGK